MELRLDPSDDPTLRAPNGVTPLLPPSPERARGAAPPGYEIVGELGRGGMGVVYKVRHVQLNRLVALKMILSGAHADRDEFARFRREAEAVARLRHPHVVQIHDFGESDGLPFLTLELVEGGSLAERLKPGPLPCREAARLAEMLAHGLHAVHESGVVHRDLKPANILLTPDGVPKITDFGLAKPIDSSMGLTESGAVVGTPSYMAPEQASGNLKAIGPHTDVYALGALLYEMLTGRPPFKGASAISVLTDVLERDPERPRRMRREIDPALEAICLKCLEKSPGDRYPSAAAVAEDLAAYQRGEAVHADPDSRLRVLRMLVRETRHGEMLRIWGKVDMAMGVSVLLTACGQLGLRRMQVEAAWPSLVLLMMNVPLLLFFSWFFRFRNGPPLTAVERQGVAIWRATCFALMAMGLMVHWMGLRFEHFQALSMVPLAVAFWAHGVVLHGSFFLIATGCMALGLLQAHSPEWGTPVFGFAFAAALFAQGVKNARCKVE